MASTIKDVNKIKISLKLIEFHPLNIEKLQEIQRLIKEFEFMGVVYFLEYGDALKIGSTKLPYTRFSQLLQNAKNYANKSVGRFLITMPHTNYLENERKIHRYFHYSRSGNFELFSMCADDFLSHFYNIGLDFENRSEEMELIAEEKVKFFKKILFKGCRQNEQD